MKLEAHYDDSFGLEFIPIDAIAKDGYVKLVKAGPIYAKAQWTGTDWHFPVSPNSVHKLDFTPEFYAPAALQKDLDLNKHLTMNARAFIEANEKSPVIMGSAHPEGGITYVLKNRRTFALSLNECRSMPMPRWDL